MANSTPRPSAIPRSRHENAAGFGPTRSQAARHTTLNTLRHDSRVSTSPPAANTTLPSTSAHANAVAAITAGAREAAGAAAAGETLKPDSAVDQRSGAEIGEELEQHCVLDLAVEDDDALDASLERIDAGL